MDPYVAAMMMSLITFSACDISGGYMGSLAAGNSEDGLNWDDPIDSANNKEERAKTLLKWSVYYTACAIMWVLDKSEFVNEDTTTGRLDIPAESHNIHVASSKVPTTVGALKDYLKTKSKSGYAEHLTDSFVDATVASFSPVLLFANFSLLGTLSTLLAAPVICKVSAKLAEKDDLKESELLGGPG